MSRRVTVALSIMLVTLVSAGSAAAQKPQASPAPDARRAMLEQRLRERTGEVVKRRLALTDDQMQKLQASNRRFEQQRTALFTRERQVRRELRQQLLRGDSANQSRVAALLDQVMSLERERLDLLQNEQREVSKFLTPVQRAKLLTLQTELRRRTQELRSGAMQRQRGRGAGPPRGFNP